MVNEFRTGAKTASSEACMVALPLAANKQFRLPALSLGGWELSLPDEPIGGRYEDNTVAADPLLSMAAVFASRMSGIESLDLFPRPDISWWRDIALEFPVSRAPREESLRCPTRLPRPPRFR